MSMRRRRRVPLVESLEARLPLSGQVAPIAEPAPAAIPSSYPPEPAISLDPVLPSWVVDPTAPVEVPPP